MESKQNKQRLEKCTPNTYMLYVCRVSNEVVESGGLVLFLPWVAKWFPTLSGYNKIRKHIDEFGTAFQQPVDKHIKNYSEHYER